MDRPRSDAESIFRAATRSYRTGAACIPRGPGLRDGRRSAPERRGPAAIHDAAGGVHVPPAPTAHRHSGGTTEGDGPGIPSATAWHRRRTPSATGAACHSATPPTRPIPRHRPAVRRVGPPAGRRHSPATSSTARSPAAAWAPSSRGATPSWAATSPSRSCRDDLRDDDVMVRRFVEEAQIGGQLQHPGIVPIYELGGLRRPPAVLRDEAGQGTHPGRSAQGAARPRDDLPRFLSIFEQVCQTMAYAHARGVIHRDLKPSNVMVGSFGEVQVMDWGLAKVLPAAARSTTHRPAEVGARGRSSPRPRAARSLRPVAAPAR